VIRLLSVLQNANGELFKLLVVDVLLSSGWMLCPVVRCLSAYLWLQRKLH